MSKIIAMVGISGVGKSTWVNHYLEKNADARVVSRDKLRELLFGYSEDTISKYYVQKDLHKREKEVSHIQDTLIKKFIGQGKTVIVDNTHLKQEYLNQLGEYGVPVETKLIQGDVELCIMSDARRNRSVGETVIRRQYRQLNDLLRVLTPVMTIDYEIPQNRDFDSAYIFDIDGTLSHMSGRSPYDWKRVGEDECDFALSVANNALNEYEQHLIICTGRDESCREETEKWLEENAVDYAELYMRPAGSNEADWKVKETMWRDITKSYYIAGMFDDRNQVVDHARRCGFKVFQVAEGDF